MTATSATASAGGGPAGAEEYRAPREWPFYLGLGILSGFYLLFIISLMVSTAAYAELRDFPLLFASPEIRYSLWLTLLSCCATAVLSLWVAVPIGYVMSRFAFRGKTVIDAVLDIPIVLPPLVIGLALLVFFQTRFGRAIEAVVPVTYAVPSVILAQFTVAAAFAVGLMRNTFDQINPRYEHVALTLGCSRGQAFWHVVFPQARRGILAAGTLAWARALGEFGPILLFAGATRMKTEVLPTTIFLEMSVGNIQTAVAVSLVMIAVALSTLVIIRTCGGVERIL
jgi:molybdate transport system permease protein